MRDDGTVRTPFEVAVNGLKVYGFVHKPHAFSGKLPWVLFFHGFGGTKTGRHRYLVDLSTRLAEAGIASVRFDFRGAGDSEGLFEEQTVTTQIEDALHVFQFASLDTALDPKRFSLLGRSFGGYLATLLALELQEMKRTPQSLILLVPFFGFGGGSKGTSELPFPLGWDKTKNQLTFHGMPISNQLLSELSKYSLEEVLPQVHSIPLMHMQAGKDKVVGSTHQAHYKKIREEADAESLFIDLPESDHELSDYTERMQSIEQVVGWLRKS